MSQPDWLLRLTDDELTLVRRGLHSLHDEIEAWNRKKTGFFRRFHPHEPHAKDCLKGVETLLLKLDSLEIPEKQVNIGSEDSCA